jgi:hypothetical protein
MNAVTQPHRIQLVGIGAQRDFDIAQTLPPCQLGERHDTKLLGASHAAYPGIARVVIDDTRDTRPWHKLHDLRKQRLARIHAASPGVSTQGNYTKMKTPVSNRHQTKSTAKPRQYWLLHNLISV